MTTWTAWNPPPAPERDLWWAAQRITVPDTTDWTARHRRGAVRLPWTIGEQREGDLVPAWVCCDPACGGVELGDATLQLNHACCGVCLCNGLPTFKGAPAERRGMCRAGFGTLHYRGWFHGPFTPFWEPGGAR